MFDLNQASEGNVSLNYQTTGVHDNIMVSEVVLEKTSANQVDYMRLVTKGSAGEVGTSPKMFLGTEIKEGKKTSGWGVTARNLVDLIKATHNVDEETAKSMIKGIASKEELAAKVSALLVGKPFRAKFKGVTTSKGTIIAELGQAESMRITPTKMVFNALRDIKPYSGPVESSLTDEPVADASQNEALPF